MHAQGSQRAAGRTRLLVQKIKNVRSFLALAQYEDAKNDQSECAQQAAEFVEFETQMNAYYEQNKVSCPPHFAVGGKVVVRLNSSLRSGNGSSHVHWYRARISQVLNAEHTKLRCKLVDYFVKRDVDACDVRVVMRKFDETVCLPNVKLCLLSGVDKKSHAEFEQFVCDTLKVGEVYEAEMAHASDSRSNAFSLRVYLNFDLLIGSIGRTTRCINEYIIESAKHGAPIRGAQTLSSSHTTTKHSETKLQTIQPCKDAASCSSDVNSCPKREPENSTEQKKCSDPVADDDGTKLKAKITKATDEDQGSKAASPTRARSRVHKSKMRMTFDESDFARECLTFFEQRLPPRAFEFTELPTLHGALRDVLLNRVDCYYRQLNTLQAYVVPYLMAGHHVVAIAPRGRGKTNALALPIVNDFVKNSRYLQNTPVSVVLCSSWERVSLMRQVLNELFGMVMSTNDVSILAAYGGDGRDDEALQSDLLNGAHVLIVTPFVLARLIRAHAVDLRRTVHLFIDDADEVLARQAEYVSTVFVHFDALREERLLRSGGVQLALTARSYTNEIVEFCETRSVRFVFTFDSIAEAAIYCRLAQSVLPTFGEAITASNTCGKQSHARERDARIERKLVALVEYLKSVTKYRKRIIVFVEPRDDFTVTDRLRKALPDVHVSHMREPYEEVQLRTVLDDFLLESRGAFAPLTKHHRVVPDNFARRRCCLLVLTDASLDRQLICNKLRQSADLVVHFKLEQKELFGKRLLLLHKTAFLDHYTDDSDDAKEVEEALSGQRLAPLPGFGRRPTTEFNSVAKSCMLVGEEHVEQLGALVDYWKRARVQVPAEVLQAIARADFDHTRRLCSRWLAFAECDERDRCTQRHGFVPGDFALHREFPRDATLRFRVQRVVDASCFYVQLLEAYERRGGDPIRRYRPRFEAVSFDLQLHFADARNRVAPRNLYVGLVCAVRDPSRRCALARFADFDVYSEWFRVRIVRCSEQVLDRRCDALFVDVGCLRTLSQDELFELPQFLQAAEPSALPVFAVNIKPADLHLAWTPEANRFAKQRCVGKLFVGRLTLSTDRYLWIASMRERQFYADVNRYADQPRLTTLLIENAFGVINSSHIVTLSNNLSKMAAREFELNPSLLNVKPKNNEDAASEINATTNFSGDARNASLPVANRVAARAVTEPPKSYLQTLPTDRRVAVEVSSICSPSYFWIKRVDCNEQLSKLEVALADRLAEFLAPEVLELTDYMFALSLQNTDSTKRTWNRAVITAVERDADGRVEKLDVYYADYGDSEYIELRDALERVRLMPEADQTEDSKVMTVRKLYFSLPFQAIPCSLACIRTMSESRRAKSSEMFDLDSNWNVDIVDLLNLTQYGYKTPRLAEFNSARFFVEVLEPLSADLTATPVAYLHQLIEERRRCGVELHDAVRRESISHALVGANYARLIPKVINELFPTKFEAEIDPLNHMALFLKPNVSDDTRLIKRRLLHYFQTYLNCDKTFSRFEQLSKHTDYWKFQQDWHSSLVRRQFSVIHRREPFYSANLYTLDYSIWRLCRRFVGTEYRVQNVTIAPIQPALKKLRRESVEVKRKVLSRDLLNAYSGLLDNYGESVPVGVLEFLLYNLSVLLRFMHIADTSTCEPAFRMCMSFINHIAHTSKESVTLSLTLEPVLLPQIHRFLLAIRFESTWNRDLDQLLQSVSLTLLEIIKYPTDESEIFNESLIEAVLAFEDGAVFFLLIHFFNTFRTIESDTAARSSTSLTVASANCVAGCLCGIYKYRQQVAGGEELFYASLTLYPFIELLRACGAVLRHCDARDAENYLRHIIDLTALCFEPAKQEEDRDALSEQEVAEFRTLFEKVRRFDKLPSVCCKKLLGLIPEEANDVSNPQVNNAAVVEQYACSNRIAVHPEVIWWQQNDCINLKVEIIDVIESELRIDIKVDSIALRAVSKGRNNCYFTFEFAFYGSVDPTESLWYVRPRSVNVKLKKLSVVAIDHSASNNDGAAASDEDWPRLTKIREKLPFLKYNPDAVAADEDEASSWNRAGETNVADKKSLCFGVEDEYEEKRDNEQVEDELRKLIGFSGRRFADVDSDDSDDDEIHLAGTHDDPLEELDTEEDLS